MVRLESTTGEQIQVFEIETKSFGNNVALNGTARQSSTLRESIDHIASNAIDGNTQTFSHTDDAHPYLEIDLGDRFELHRVIIHNRWCTNSTDPEGWLLMSISSTDIITMRKRAVAQEYTASAQGAQRRLHSERRASTQLLQQRPQ